jgi:hypothetical protein
MKRAEQAAVDFSLCSPLALRWNTGKWEGDQPELSRHAFAATALTAASLATGNRKTKTAPPSGLFWQVICPL